MYADLKGEKMKFIHISDLHIGKRLNEYSLIEDQKYILNEIIKIVKGNKPDCVFIAGDIYDKTMPSAEAVKLLDEFLGNLSDANSKIFIISGNHDSAERIAYGAQAFKKQGIYMSPVFEGSISKTEITDAYGKVNVYLLPFIKPAHVKRFYENVESYTDAVTMVLKECAIDKAERNVLLAHQFVTGAERSESEEVPIGGLDNVEAFAFDGFDYVALGHLHKCQKVSESIYYSGTPLKFSASECGDEKCVLLGEIKEKGDLTVTKIPLVPYRDYVDIKGTIDCVLKKANNSFTRITLTDEETVVDAYGKLKGAFPFMTELLFERNRKSEMVAKEFSIEKSAHEQFEDFYKTINGKAMTEEQRKVIKTLLEEIEEERA